MSGDDTRKPLRRTIRGGRSFFFDEPAVDKVLNMVVTLGSEVWALRERLAAVEALQQRRGQLAAGEVDAYEFTPDEELRLATDRKEFIDNLFRVLREQVEAATVRATTSRAGTAISGRSRATAPRARRKAGKSAAKGRGRRK